MKFVEQTFKCILFLFLLIATSHAQKPPNNIKGGIIPSPNAIVIGSRSNINELSIYVSKDWKNNYLFSLIKDTYKAVLVDDPKMANTTFEVDQKMSSGAYSLEIKKNNIKLIAADGIGLQYAMISLSQLVNHHGYPLPKVQIVDQPLFKYRGMHLDVSRHFFDVGEIKKYLDFLTYYKYNYFHWHLTDDQGWRIEIKKYPKLHETGGFRKETLIGHYSDQPHQFDKNKYGGFYSQNEIKEIVQYATERNITVIPEIEMPGHALAALSAYPELGCGKQNFEAATKWGIFDDVFCPNDTTFKFLEGVIDEVCDLFPSNYIHIGGDECPKTAWENSEFCQNLIKQKGLKDEHELQSYFITTMEKYINSKGKKIIGWDEILEGGLAPNATVMSWRGISGGLSAARQNHPVIMTPGTHCYFDHYQSESSDEPLAIGGYTSMEKVYHWNPIPNELEVDKHQFILGGQANVWTEYIPNFHKVEYMAFARGMAMSEALWTSKKDYPNYVARFDKHHQWWTQKDANVAYHIYDLKPRILAGNGKGVAIIFKAPNGAIINHQIEDRPGFEIASGDTILINENGIHSFQAFNGEKSGKKLTLDVDLHLGTTSKIKISPEPSSQYGGNGEGSIINGIKGSDKKYGGSEWLGFAGKDVLIDLDFGKDTVFNYVDCRFFKGEGQWIYLPASVELFSSFDGKNFSRIAGARDITSISKVSELRLTAMNSKARYLRLDIKNYGTIPSGAQGAGHKAWLFIDEITIK